jgi:multiple antibiotic resistance protein
MSVVAFGALCMSSLFTVIDPIGVAPIFASMTSGADSRARRRFAFKACLTALCVLAAFAVGGSALLRLFGVTIEAFQIAGGILFGLLGLSMLDLTGHGEKPDDVTDEQDPSVVPLGVPLIGGPGAMTTVMVLTGQAETWGHATVLGAAVVIVMALTWLILVMAPSLLARLGREGIALTTKLMGLVVLVIGVQFVIDGVVTVVGAFAQP